MGLETGPESNGVDHLGLQVDDDSELEEIAQRLKTAGLNVYDEGDTTCCYAESNKAWVQDPAGIAWETYRTMADVEVFKATNDVDSSCCAPTLDTTTPSSCC